MRLARSHCVLLLALGACDGDVDVTELSVDIVTDGTGVTVTFREPARPDCECTEPALPALGECMQSAENFSCTCDPRPASCLESIEFLRDGEVVALGQTPQELGDYWSATLRMRPASPFDEIRLRGCGGRATILMPSTDYIYPEATIVATERTPTNELRVDWTTAPPAPFVLESRREDLVQASCLAPNDGTATFDDPDFITVAIQPLEPIEISTPLGTATIWAGKQTIAAP